MSGMKPIVWTIAGSDSGGGAGIQADNSVIRAFGVHPCTVVTALTAQNSYAVEAVEVTSTDMFNAQLKALVNDLFPAAVKTGLLGSVEQVRDLAAFYTTHLTEVPLLVDPVAISTSGDSLAGEGVLAALVKYLLPLASLITPNIHELSILSGRAIQSTADVYSAAQFLLTCGARAVLVKGGHAHWQGSEAEDYFISADRQFRLKQPRLFKAHSHGTGCTMATAIAAGLAKGELIEDAVVEANAYIAQGLQDSFPVGRGAGPVAHSQLPVEGRYFARLADDLTEPAAGKAFPALGITRPGLYPVADHCDLLERLLGYGVKTIQLRVKPSPQVKTDADLTSQVKRAIALGERFAARVFINDHWQIAIEQGAYGIHLGQEDLEHADLEAIRAAGLRLGISTHGPYELLRAKALKPSYIALGHVFSTPTKVMKSKPQGIPRLKQYVELSQSFPTVAIGGIDSSNIAAVKASGVGGVAVVRATQDGEHLQARVQELADVIGF